eukprot:TRINITY_DN2978_c0_g1_i1.p1 TRINITY_DN2978_c0_g1~~TRINITY_DN2978_c0_g1_i1.p1  ORF type:complete len:426 (-),score=104.60 TRINITY_DN2978_c0_g1_i1:179-1456(-)
MAGDVSTAGKATEGSLPELFKRGRSVANESESLASSDAEGQGKVVQACLLLEECTSRIETLGLFSSNEDKEDLSTANIKYLLVPYYLAELEQWRTDGERRQHVQCARKQFSAFVRRCTQYGLLSEADRLSVFRSAPADPQARRAEKIERFKRQRALQAKVEELIERIGIRQSKKVGPGQTEDEEADELPVGVDEEDVRELWFTEVSLALPKAIDGLEALKREEQLLQTVAENGENGGPLSREALDERLAKGESWHRETAERARMGALGRRPMIPFQVAAQALIEGRAGLDRNQGGQQQGLIQFQQTHHHHHHHHHPQLFGPASLTMSAPSSDRERMASQVFQPAHSLPTMSIEEAGMREMEIMNAFQEQNVKYAEEMAAAAFQSDNGPKGTDSDDEAAEVKARSWDDWKDEHPKGAGNRKATPCG